MGQRAAGKGLISAPLLESRFSLSYFSLFFDPGKTPTYNVRYTVAATVTDVVRCSRCGTAVTSWSRPCSSSQTDRHTLGPPPPTLPGPTLLPPVCGSDWPTGLCGWALASVLLLLVSLRVMSPLL